MMEFKDKDGNVTHTLTDEGLVSRIGTQAPGVKLEVTCKHDWHFTSRNVLRCQRCGAETSPRTPDQLAQDMLRDVTIQFFGGVSTGPSVEVLRISKDGVWVNPDVPTNEIAKEVLKAIDHNIKHLVDRVRDEEREACAKVCEQLGTATNGIYERNYECAAAIRARKNT